MTRSSFPPLFGHFAVWVTVWVKPIFTDLRKTIFLKWNKHF